MVVFDTDGNVIEEYDLETGYITSEAKEVAHSWVVDSEATGHYETIAEYPNGGKDVEWVIDTDEVGHWETRDDEGEIVEHFDGTIPDDLPHDVANPDVWTYQVYHAYTEEELTERQAQREAEEVAARISVQTMAAIPMMVQVNSASIPDAQAVTIPLLFKKWTPGETYTLHEIVRYEVDGELYRIGQPEIRALNVYKPGDIGTESIYSHIKINEEGYEEWKPWDGISGIYKQDQIVSDPYDEGNLYKSKIPNNVWGPPSQQPTYWKKV